MKLGGGISIHAKWKGVGGQARVHGRGERRPCPPPLEMEKKMLSEEILTSFTYVLLMKLRGNRYTIPYMQNGRGWSDRCVSMVGGGEGALPPSLEIGKKEAVRGNFNVFHLYFTTFLI